MKLTNKSTKNITKTTLEKDESAANEQKKPLFETDNKLKLLLNIQ